MTHAASTPHTTKGSGYAPGAFGASEAAMTDQPAITPARYNPQTLAEAVTYYGIERQSYDPQDAMRALRRQAASYRDATVEPWWMQGFTAEGEDEAESNPLARFTERDVIAQYALRLLLQHDAEVTRPPSPFYLDDDALHMDEVRVLEDLRYIEVSLSSYQRKTWASVPFHRVHLKQHGWLSSDYLPACDDDKCPCCHGEGSTLRWSCEHQDCPICDGTGECPCTHGANVHDPAETNPLQTVTRRTP